MLTVTVNTHEHSQAMLRSANYGELVEPRTRGKRYGPRSFRVAVPFVWNNLPRHLRNDDISHEQFARDLKTVLFCMGLFVKGAFENVCLKVALQMDLLTYLLIKGRTIQSKLHRTDPVKSAVSDSAVQY